MGLLDLNQEAAQWINSKDYALDLRDRFTSYVNTDLDLLDHRLYIERHAYGMGERCFHWLWKLIVDQMPEFFKFLEVGVYKGQIPSLIRLLANRTNREAEIFGVTLLSNSSGGIGERPNFPEGDYGKYIWDLHKRFDLEQPTLIVGDSTNPLVQSVTAEQSPFEIIYIDGCHEYDFVSQDLRFYPTLLKPGGFLVVDDASNFLEQPWGFFQGIESVSKAVRAVIETDPKFEHLLAVVHDRVWRKK
ncbi:MAG: hypothetical protein AMJ88_16795 [Anaerolineae bacterium SM23_ 63]|nr:MAG: hypothetical protein AMJ88_16795 [Anaerolineae bacterium SM23_ 63]